MKRRALLQTAAAIAAVPITPALAGSGTADAHKGQPINIVFDGPPGPEAGRFVDSETDDGKGIRVGEWIERPDGTWALRITNFIGIQEPTIPTARRVLIEAFVDDPGFRDVYLANIACCLMDEQGGAKIAGDFKIGEVRDRYAEHIMNHLFNPRELLCTSRTCPPPDPDPDPPESQEWPTAEGQWVMARVGDYELPGVCSTIDGGCVNVTLLDGTVCPAHRPLTGTFRVPSAEEAARYWQHMAPHEAVTVWHDGSFRLWHRQDAELAANDPDWSHTITAPTPSG